jgi:flavodoxin
MSRILVVYGSTYGQTERVAHRHQRSARVVLLTQVIR